jgi:hypothetical protein
MEEIIYNSSIKDISITYKLDYINKEVWMMEFKFLDPQIKIFMQTLRQSIEDLLKKGYEKLIQIIPIVDWIFIKNNNWIIIHTFEKEQLYVIKCDLKDAIEFIAQGLGVYEDHTEYKTIENIEIINNLENIKIDNKENIKIDNKENIKIDNKENIKIDNKENIKIDNKENIINDLENIKIDN